MHTSLYDLSPLLRMLVLGALLGAGPLLWVLWRTRSQTPASRVQMLTVLTLFLTFDLVLFGAFTRLTDSGLGCPDWPGCYGQASPLGAHAQISAAQEAMPTGPVTHGKAWVEMVHRYLASGVGFLILVLAVLGWRARRPVWPTATLVWVCVQGAFGALTVTMKLFPAIVTLHLLGGYLLLALLAAQAAAASAPAPVSTSLRWASAAALGLLLVQAASGAWVSTNYAVLACTSVPLCQGVWWPDMDFSAGFALWRPLGLQADGSLLTLQALTAIHVVHRLMALFTALCLALLAWRWWRQPALQGLARWLAALLLLQLATGLSNVVLGWPLLAAVLHTGGAGAMVVVLVWGLRRMGIALGHNSNPIPAAPAAATTPT